MRTLQVIKTIKWLESLLTNETKEMVFEWGVVAAAREDARRGEGPRAVVKAAHDLARFAGAVNASGEALEVLRAFGLAPLATPKFAEDFALLAAVREGQDAAALHDGAGKVIGEVVRPWIIMVGSCAAIEKLTVPAELQVTEPPPEVVSLEMLYREPDGVDLQTLAKAVELIESAYSAIAEIYPGDTRGQLKIIKVESGSSIRFDCRGLGDAVRHFKEFFLEAWHKYRHQKPEDLTVNNSAVLSSLSVLKEVAKREQAGDLSPEKAELLRRSIVDSTLGLFQRGVLPAEVAEVEIVNNVALLGQFNPKLLTDGGGVPADSDASGKPPRKRKRRMKPPEG